MIQLHDLLINIVFLNRSRKTLIQFLYFFLCSLLIDYHVFFSSFCSSNWIKSEFTSNLTHDNSWNLSLFKVKFKHSNLDQFSAEILRLESERNLITRRKLPAISAHALNTTNELNFTNIQNFFLYDSRLFVVQIIVGY